MANERKSTEGATCNRKGLGPERTSNRKGLGPERTSNRKGVRGAISRFFWEPIAEAQQEQAKFLSGNSHGGIDKETCLILLLTPVMLTIQEYVFRSGEAPAYGTAILASIPGSIGEQLRRLVADPANWQLLSLAWWASGTLITYLLIPASIVWLVLGKTPSDYGLKLRGSLASWPVYLGMYGLILPGVLWASTTLAFQSKYPFYRLASEEPLWPRFWIWQLMYAMQFLSLEFFFRGLLVHGVRRSCGVYSILVMTIPYCQIHFGKPMLETLGAIVAGVTLGFMSLKTRSVVLGAALHIAVALTMDFAALRIAGRW